MYFGLSYRLLIAGANWVLLFALALVPFWATLVLGQEAAPPAEPSLGSPPVLPPIAPSAPTIAVPPSMGELPRDLSPWGMFIGADVVVKAVLIGLAFASVVTWTVWLAKTIELMAARLA